MRTLVWLMWPMCLGVASSALGGCVRHYREPAVDEPHAMVRVRVVRHAWAGPMIDEVVELGPDRITMPRAGPQPSVQAIRVRPGPAEWRFSTTFFHTEQRTRLENYRESYPCGSHTSYSNGTSHTQTRTCYRNRTRTVVYQARVPDATCQARVQHDAVVGDAYLIQYDFMGHGQCTAQCLQQLPQPDGQFRLVRCGAGPAVASPTAAPPQRPLPYRGSNAASSTTAGGAAPLGTP